MKSMYEQEKAIFARHADIAGGKYISVEKVEQLLGKDAARYAVNASKGYFNRGAYYNIHDDVAVLTVDSFLMAFSFFHMMEIKKGLYNAWQTPNFLDRPEFALQKAPEQSTKD